MQTVPSLCGEFVVGQVSLPDAGPGRTRSPTPLPPDRIPSPPATSPALSHSLDCVSRLLHVMQSSRQPLLRATVATAFRHLARGAPMRQLLATAGTIPALSLLLQSPSSTARQAAARAVSNLVVNCGGWVGRGRPLAGAGHTGHCRRCFRHPLPW